MIILKLSNEYFLYLYSYLAISFPDYQLKYFQELIVPKKYLTNSKMSYCSKYYFYLV